MVGSVYFFAFFIGLDYRCALTTRMSRDLVGAAGSDGRISGSGSNFGLYTFAESPVVKLLYVF